MAGSRGPTVVDALPRWMIAISSLYFYALHKWLVYVLLSRSTRLCESMHGHASTTAEQVIASIIDDSRCGISDVAFCTAPPIGGLSCLYMFYGVLYALEISRELAGYTVVNDMSIVKC